MVISVGTSVLVLCQEGNQGKDFSDPMNEIAAIAKD